MTAPLPYLLLTVKPIKLEEVFPSDMQNLRTVCYHNDSQWQIFSSEQAQFIRTSYDAIISERKHFLSSSSCILNLYSVLNIFKKKMTLIAYVFLNIRTLKIVVR